MAEKLLTGKVAVVTGAGRGIGKAIALAFARAGADVAICARSEIELERVNEAITELGQKCFSMPVDLSDAKQVSAFCHGILLEFDAVDVLVNNAGVYLERGAFAESDPALWWKTMEVNVRGPYLMTRHLCRAPCAKAERSSILRLVRDIPQVRIAVPITCPRRR